MANKNKGGRPTVMTEMVLHKLEEVFAIGGTDKEACFYADIATQTLYKYQEENPEFIERKEALKEKPILKARQTVVKALDNPQDARWYLERKRKKEFSGVIDVKHTGSITLEPDQRILDLAKKLNS